MLDLLLFVDINLDATFVISICAVVDRELNRRPSANVIFDIYMIKVVTAPISILRIPIYANV